jgi:hypothetical protein
MLTLSHAFTLELTSSHLISMWQCCYVNINPCEFTLKLNIVNINLCVHTQTQCWYVNKVSPHVHTQTRFCYVKIFFITKAPKTRVKRFPSKLHFKLKTFPLYTGEGMLPSWAFTPQGGHPQIMVGPGHRPFFNPYVYLLFFTITLDTRGVWPTQLEAKATNSLGSTTP